jgi:hypothetical protein
MDPVDGAHQLLRAWRRMFSGCELGLLVSHGDQARLLYHLEQCERG